MSPAELKRRLEEAIPDSVVTVTDLTGTEDHYEIDVVSPAFTGLSLLARQRMVYAPLAPWMSGEKAEIHALSMKTRTP